MSEPIVYIGYLEFEENGEVFVKIAVSPYPKVFTGEHYPITADYGEGSCGNLFIKLDNQLKQQEVKK
ncbi:MAG: hypothetical protein Q8N63_00480 [Nanoarchaeota archaeon]|nr:hypothetical protein [Nanoarchaeota archaeon]